MVNVPRIIQNTSTNETKRKNAKQKMGKTSRNVGKVMEDTDKKFELNDSRIIFSAEKIGIPIETL